MSCLADDLPTREAPPAPASKAPVTSLTTTKVDGVHTDLAVTNYSDRLFVVVSQLGKLGTIVEARREKAQSDKGDEGAGAGRPVYQVTVLLGKESEEVELVGRLLAERLALGKPIVVCVAVKGITFDLAKKLADLVIEHVQAGLS